MIYALITLLNNGCFFACLESINAKHDLVFRKPIPSQVHLVNHHQPRADFSSDETTKTAALSDVRENQTAMQASFHRICFRSYDNTLFRL